MSTHSRSCLPFYVPVNVFELFAQVHLEIKWQNECICADIPFYFKIATCAILNLSVSTVVVECHVPAVLISVCHEVYDTRYDQYLNHALFWPHMITWILLGTIDLQFDSVPILFKGWANPIGVTIKVYLFTQDHSCQPIFESLFFPSECVTSVAILVNDPVTTEVRLYSMSCLAELWNSYW